VGSSFKCVLLWSLVVLTDWKVMAKRARERREAASEEETRSRVEVEVEVEVEVKRDEDGVAAGVERAALAAWLPGLI
jgi:hypothetical protein